MSISIKPLVFSTSRTHNGDNLNSEIKVTPKIFATTTTKNGQNLNAEINCSPLVFATTITRVWEKLNSEIKFTPKIFALVKGTELAELNAPITFKPRFFATVITDKNPPSPVMTRADTLVVSKKNVQAQADTLIRVINRATADTCIKVVRVEKGVADTVIRVPRILRYVVGDDFVSLRGTKSLRNTSDVSLVNSFKDYGITAFDISLNEKTLSDNFTLETTKTMDIGDEIRGQLLDYEFNFLVEGTSQSELTQTIHGMYDVDKLLYSSIFFNDAEILIGDNTNIFVTAGSYIQQIAQYFGLNSNIRIDDFTPYHDFTSSNITYSDLLSTVFGWTSRLPQRQINVFIRGGTLHCIQRGLEETVFDITNLPHSRPTISRSLVRSMWNNPFGNTSDEETSTEPFTGVINYSNPETTLSIRYTDGLLMTEYCRQQDGHKYTSDGIKSESTSQKNYSYISLNGSDEHYLSEQVVSNESIQYDEDEQTKTVETITTTYNYKVPTSGDTAGEVYLFEENETTEKKELSYSKGVWTVDDETGSVRKTFHLPVGNGWYVQNVFVDGVFQGSNLSQGRPNNTVSLYTVQQANKGLRRGTGANNPTYEERRQKLAPIFDTSFPVRELDLLSELTAALLWLNRKIQEEISVDLISNVDKGVPSINHIVDFTERVLLDGNEYYLVSNQVQFTPRKLIQHLKLVRWYAQ